MRERKKRSPRQRHTSHLWHTDVEKETRERCCWSRTSLKLRTSRCAIHLPALLLHSTNHNQKESGEVGLLCVKKLKHPVVGKRAFKGPDVHTQNKRTQRKLRENEKRYAVVLLCAVSMSWSEGARVNSFLHVVRREPWTGRKPWKW